MGSDCEYLGIPAKVINSSYEQVDCMAYTFNYMSQKNCCFGQFY
jgi:hypothetical protein